jgi:hypothetical protein
MPRHPTREEGAREVKFTCWIPDFREEEGESLAFTANDAEDAAGKYAERLCQGDPDYYSTFLKGALTVMVRSEVGIAYEVEVHAVESIDFYANVKEASG